MELHEIPPQPPSTLPDPRVVGERFGELLEQLLGRPASQMTSGEAVHLGLAFVHLGLTTFGFAKLHRGAVLQLVLRAVGAYPCACSYCEDRRARASCTGPGGVA
jgi:hypothetical protein